jgi:hypothetical protein
MSRRRSRVATPLSSDDSGRLAVMRRGYARELGDYLRRYLPDSDACYLSDRFSGRADEGTLAYWPELVEVAIRLRADRAVAGLPVTEETVTTHARVLAEPLVVPVWGV